MSVHSRLMKISNAAAIPDGMVSLTGGVDDATANIPFRGTGAMGALTELQPSSKMARLKEFALRNRTPLGAGLGLAAGLGAGAGLASIGRNNSMQQY